MSENVKSIRLKKIKQTIYGKPYLLDSAYKMSFAQAEALTQQEGFLPISETIARAKAKSNLPEEAWEPVHRLLAKKKRPGAQAMLYLRRHRVAAIIAACFLVVMLGFTSPTVRAYAVELYQKAVRLVAGKMEVFTPDPTSDQHGNAILDEPDGNIHAEPSVSFYNSLDELWAEKGIAPSLTLGNTDFMMQEIALTEWAGLVARLKVTYVSPEGKIVAIESNLRGDDTVSSLPDNAEVWTMPAGDLEMICAIDPIDGSFSGNIAIDGIPVSVYAEKGIDTSALEFCIE